MSGEDRANRTLSYADSFQIEERTFVAPYLVLALECERPLTRSVRFSLAEVDRAVIGRGAERSWSRVTEAGRGVLRVAVEDGWMSGRHLALERTDGSWRMRDDGSKNGSFINGRPATEAALVDGDVIEAGSTLFLFRDRVRRGAREAPDQVGSAAGVHPALATLNPELARALSRLPKLAASGVAVVIGGETGTGKELTARALHDLASRPGPFLAVNCGALPEGLIEAELFGARRGAYSGASEDRVGLVRAAHGGTLFLDEVAELPAGSQVKLLRFLQEGEVTPLGATQPIPVDVRILAASHCSLPELVEAGRFRADLYARLAGAHVALRALRERREDLGLLIAALLVRVAGGEDAARAITLEREAARALFLYGWPLNVRELEQALRAACALAPGGRIRLGQLPEAVRGVAAARGKGGADATTAGAELALRDQLVHLLTEHRGNVSAVARSIGKARVQVRRWCRRFGLDPEAYRDQ